MADERRQQSYAYSQLAPKSIAACMGSLLTSVVVNPFDVVRIRLQHHSATAKTPTTSLKNTARPIPGTVAVPSTLGVDVCCKDAFWYPSKMDYCVATATTDPCIVRPAGPKKWTTFGVMTSIVKNEGVTTLWRGLSLQLLQGVPANVVYLIAYEHLRDNSPIRSSALNPLVCGGLARMLASTVVSPIELVKTRLQAVPGKDAVSIVRNSIRLLVKEHGVLSLWNGLTLTLWRDVPFSAIYWFVVETCRGYFREMQNPYRRTDKRSASDTLMENIFAGTVGGVAASLMTSPFDVGKTRVQLLQHLGHTRMIPSMLHIVRTEGIQALFVGAVPRLLKVAPACAIMVSSYELGKHFLEESPGNRPGNQYELNDH